ncbi:MAG: hypothetical protein K2M48_00815, partial [Clostridiales bacterium]|nr:hypothetical protein [Clostridiales bacterium]
LIRIVQYAYMNRYETETEKPTSAEALCTADEKKQTLFYGCALEALEAAVPQGATVKAIGFDSVDSFLRAGYRAVDVDADVVIARGGEREFDAARAAMTAGAKLILCPTHAFPAAASSLYRTTDGAFAVAAQGEKPLSSAFDASDVDGNLASIFGEIAALDLCAFDMFFGARMRGEADDKTLCDEIAALVTNLTDALAPVVKDRARASALLVDAGKKAARIVERVPALLHHSGAAQMTEAVRMLYSAEERPIGMRGETEYLLGAFVVDYYIKNFEGRPIEFPPDNNRRIDSLCEYFNVDVRRACIHTTAIYPPLKMRLCEYRRTEFRDEFLKRLYGVKRRRVAAWRVFKRLYPDDGYCLKTLVDREDLGICLALAPDVYAADTMLSFLKQTGRLDRYIV